MRIKITAIQGGTVLAETKFGQIRGEFHPSSLNFKPCEQKEYEVELSCEETLTEESVSISTSKKPSIQLDKDMIRITGFVESAEDCVCFLRLQESLVMFELDCNTDWKKIINQNITILISSMHLYDVTP